MRSRAARITASAAALTGLAAAGFIVFNTEQEIALRRRTLRSFDLRAREAAGSLAEMRAAERAYVAAGQSIDFWTPRVATLLEEAAPKVDGLRALAASSEARAALLEASAGVTEFGNVDRRAREYMRAGQLLMAGDVVFAEGGETAAAASHKVETARNAEQQAFDAAEARLRRRQALAMGGAAGLGALMLVALAMAAPKPREPEAYAIAANAAAADFPGGLLLRQPGGPAPSATPAEGESGAEPGAASGAAASGAAAFRGPSHFKAVADLCTDFGRVASSTDLQRLLPRAATLMDASGMVVWLGDRAGGDLRPVLAHGYADQVLARMAAVPRTADNAAAAAYRSGKLQIVMRHPGVSNGAVVAPLLAPEGSIGALAAEISGGSETSDTVQSLATLVAAQLTSLLSGSVLTADSTTRRAV